VTALSQVRIGALQPPKEWNYNTSPAKLGLRAPSFINPKSIINHHHGAVDD
jgi:hypothetical protein